MTQIGQRGPERYGWPMPKFNECCKITYIGMRFYNDSKPNYKQAVWCFERECEDHDPMASYCLGVCYMTGRGVAQNTDTALRYWSDALKHSQQNAFARKYVQNVMEIGACNGWTALKNLHIAAQQQAEMAQTENTGKMQPRQQKLANSQQQKNNSQDKAAVDAYRIGADSGDSNAEYEPDEGLFDANGTQQDRNGAPKWYMADAAQDNMKVVSKLAECYALGFYEPDSDQEAFQLFQLVEHQNDHNVLCALGKAFNFGWGIEKDVSKAVRYYTRAADAGSYEATLRLRDCKNKNVDNELTAAFQHFKQLADTGDVAALFNLGSCQYYGIGCTKSDKLAANTLQKAADSGCNNAVVLLGVLYQYGHGVEENEAKAFELYKRTADAGNKEGQFWLGECYYYAVGVAQNYKQAAVWYEKAAVQGHSEAAGSLGYCHENEYGVENDVSKGFQYYKQAAIAGNMSGQHNAGCCYENGNGVQQSYARAVYWYQKAVDQEHAGAMTNLGFCYEYGQGVSKNIQKASNLYKKAAEAGKAVAQYNLANFYYCGTGIEQNYKLALDWYTKAAKNGYKLAFEGIGDIYYHGRGVEVDSTKAAENYEKAGKMD